MRVLALDLGEKRIGIAVSDPLAILARPLSPLIRRSKEKDFAFIAALVGEHGVGLVVVGLPLSLDGSKGPKARWAVRYADALAAHLAVPVVVWDERFTTAEAEEIMRQGRTEKERRRARSDGELDSIAAAVILQSYLDSQGEPVEFLDTDG